MWPAVLSGPWCRSPRSRRSRFAWNLRPAGAPARASGGYTLNPKGQPHSAMIAAEMVSLIIYSGEPDQIVSMEVIDVAA